MRASPRYILPMLGTSLLLAACGGSSGSSNSAAGSAAKPSANPSTAGGSATLVKTASNSQLGSTVLVNRQGLTLYHLSGERAGKFICSSGGCLNAWHPLVVPAGTKPNGTVGSLGLVKRPDGSEQVAYKGMPLYTFVQDTAPGQANGQGIKDVGIWTAVATSAGSKASPAASSTTSQSSSKGYGY